jgi:hypothetical protein
VLDDAMLESLEELLIQADMGVDTAVRVTANIAEGRFGAKRLGLASCAGRWRRGRADHGARGAADAALPDKSRRSCWWWA